MSGKYYWEPGDNVDAIFSNDHQFRYKLQCVWSPERGIVTFVMMNPSIGDKEQCDFTLHRCRSFAKEWGYGGMIIVNLFALVSTDQDGLSKHAAPVGTENDRVLILAAQESEKLILAWGEEKTLQIRQRARYVKNLFAAYETYCIQKSKNQRYPRHPSRLMKGLSPIVFSS